MTSSVAVYELGALVYEPFLGLCTVVRSSPETMLGVQQTFYELEPRLGGAAVKVPAGQMLSRGIRSLLSVSEIETVLATEAAADHTADEDSNERVRRWTNLLRSEERSGGYQFLREWQMHSAAGTRLSSKEGDMRDKIARTLSQEMAQVLEIPSRTANSRLNAWLEPNVTQKGKKKRV